MKVLLKNGYKAKLRPSGHDISENFSIDNGAAIPSKPYRHRTHGEQLCLHAVLYRTGHKAAPGKIPVDLPEFFVRMLTDTGDLVIDPFGGSCVTGEACERLERRWVCCELVEEYLQGALGRFQDLQLLPVPKGARDVAYKISHPGAMWNGTEAEPLAKDGGKTRIPKRKKE